MADFAKQVRLLESQDTKVAEDARQAISLQIDLGHGIPELVAYYAAHRSERALDLLCKIKEPYDKTLLDTLVDTVRNKKSHETIILLGQIVQQCPSWTPKIAMHPILRQLVDNIKKSTVVAESVAGLMFLSLLLPHCAALSHNHLQNMFGAFMSAVDLYKQKLKDIRKMGKHEASRDIEWVNVSHLAFAFREYFHTLYGIYPVNFLQYLRNVFSDTSRNDRSASLQKIVFPLFNGVRLHPSLIFNSKEKEVSRERWLHKEAHDFLDECRRVVIGLIPVPTHIQGMESAETEPDSPSVIPDSVFALLFRDEHSSTSSNMVWNDSFTFEEGDSLMNDINTPPGSVCGAPATKRSIAADDEPIIIASDEIKRRSTIGTSDGRGVFRKSFSRLFKGHDRKSFVANSPLIEVVPAEEQYLEESHLDDLLCDEAEEAVTLNIEEKIDYKMRTCSLYDERSPGPSHKDSVFSQDGHSRTFNMNSSNSIIEDDNYGTYSARINEARLRARNNIRDNKQSAKNDGKSSSNHNTSLPDSSNMDKTIGSADFGRIEESHDVVENINEPVEGLGGRGRFSVSSYFRDINRQRFVSECPTIINEDNLAELDCGKLFPSHRKINRSMSCSDLKDVAKALRASIESNHNRPPPRSRAATLLDQFPYLRLVRSVEPDFFDKIEHSLEKEHERNRGNYMKSSKNFHACLKEFGLADRLPGRIYDDMTHITSGLSIEMQRDVLLNRLQLVNQHLLYERSCRLLHANRNRRLFAKLKQQKISDAEISSLREQNCKLDAEKKDLTRGLTKERVKNNDLEVAHRKQETKLHDVIKKLEKDRDKLLHSQQELYDCFSTTEGEASKLRLQLDSYRRRADDAEELLIISKSRVDTLEKLVADHRRMYAENQSLRDQLSGIARQIDERRQSPDKESERLVRQLQTDIERSRCELERERIAREEYRGRFIEADRNCKDEAVKASEFKILLDRSSKLLREQNEAAEQKYYSLLAVTRRQEEHISDLYVKLEAANDRSLETDAIRHGNPVTIQRAGFAKEIQSCDSTGSESLPFFFQEHNSSGQSTLTSGRIRHTSDCDFPLPSKVSGNSF